jgi:Tol biopolymer transport system component
MSLLYIVEAINFRGLLSMNHEFYPLLKPLIRVALVIILVSVVCMASAQSMGQIMKGDVVSFISYNPAISDDNGSIYLFDIHSKLMWRVAEYSHSIGYPVWSHDGSLFFFFSRGDTFIADTSKRDWFTNPTLLNIDGAEWSAVPSPDGEAVIYMQYVNGGSNSYLFVADSTGANARQVTDLPVRSISSQAWSPDGRQITFAGYSENILSVYVINQDGSQQSQLTNVNRYIESPSWSPDGNHILFDSDDGIYVVDIETRNIRKLITIQGSLPVWSLDGTRILFSSNMSGNPEIYMMDVDGDHLEQLTSNSTIEFSPTWMP